MAPAVTTGAQLVAANSIGGALAAISNSSSQLLFGGADAGLGAGGSTHAPLQQLPSSSTEGFSAWQPPAAWLQEPMALPLLQPAIQEPAALQELPAPSLASQQPALVPGTAGDQLALPSMQELLQCEAKGAGLQQLQAQWMTEGASLDAGALLTNGDWSALGAAAPGMAAAPIAADGSPCCWHQWQQPPRDQQQRQQCRRTAWPGQRLAANGLSSMDITWLAAQVPESCQLPAQCATSSTTRAACLASCMQRALLLAVSSGGRRSGMASGQVCSQVLQMASAAAR